MSTPTSTFPAHASLGDQDAWWKSAVVYQIYPRSFAASNGDGIGDVPGIIGKLDYLEQLGVDVIWLSPIYKSPQDDNGYDISDYQDIDPMFGTLDDVDRLLDEAHGRGIRVVMDLVVNHTSDEHPWFIESRSSKDNPKRDWYWWRPAREGMEPGTPGAEPTNWSSFFSGSTWEYDETTGEYYLHLFSKRQPDLNWENPEVRHAVYEMMNWWLDRGIDGFRMDVINLISKVLPLKDGIVHEGEGRFGDGFPLFTNGPRVHEFMQEMYREVFEGRDKLLNVGEMPGVTIDEAKLFTDPARNELDMVFHFEHMGVDREWGKFGHTKLHLPDLKAILGRWQEGLEESGWNSLYWNNHDQPRVVSRFGNDGEYRVESAKMLAAILHLQRGTPYIYQGEEIGMTNMPFASFDDFQDIEARNYYAAVKETPGFDPDALLANMAKSTRDNARTPMQWDASEHAGFTEGTPWMPVNPNCRDINADAAVADEHSVFHFYRKLIDLRHTLPVVVNGDFRMLLPEDERIYAYTRSLDGTTMLVLGNFSDDEAPVEIDDVDAWAASELVIGNYPAQEPASGITLRPWETRVYLREGDAG
ncbi:MAG TPA: alpha-glucosidase [Thermomicrobiales bacterium]|nr:alpha-glucosidase [Thermomicrobiales bacterium]